MRTVSPSPRDTVRVMLQIEVMDFNLPVGNNGQTYLLKTLNNNENDYYCRRIHFQERIIISGGNKNNFNTLNRLKTVFYDSRPTQM